ncbi:hypothetical protein [Brevundimonas sp.]|uniref:hypothetical protein n=1 Tax=Brevundimonas sp. TaxID=1871086 RepID=UPI0035634BFB
MNRRLKSLVWPLTVLAVGALASWAAETAVGRFQAYSVYGLARPVADLLLVIGGLWLVVTLIRLASGRSTRSD